MSTPSRSSCNLTRLSEIVETDTYIGALPRVASLFHSTRTVGSDPIALYTVQSEAAELLLEFQSLRITAKAAGDALGVSTADRLILLVKRVMDALVWRVLDFDRVVIQLLSEHPQTGHLDATVHDDLDAAREVVDQESARVLVNDLSNVLRHGDLTILKGIDTFDIQENKNGKASAGNRRAVRQRRTLTDMKAFLATSTRLRGTERDYIFTPNVQVATHHVLLDRLVGEAKAWGYAQATVDEVLGLEVVWLRASDGMQLPASRPLAERLHAVSVNSLQLFDIPATKVAPYGIFPLDDAECFELITGDVLVIATLDLDALARIYATVGMTLEFPQPTPEESAAYLVAAIAERKRLLPRYNLVLCDGPQRQEVTFAHFWCLLFDLFVAQTVVDADRHLFNFCRRVQVRGTTGFYLGFPGEKKVWR